MTTSLSNLVDNLTKGIHKIKCKDCDCEYEDIKDNSIKYNCLSCNKDFLNKINEELKKRFKDRFKFSNNDINKFISLLRRVVYSCGYMDEWEKFNETSLPKKEEFYLNMEDITDADYMHAKRVCKDFEIRNLGEYYDLHLKGDTLLLADVFENFRKMCLKIYHLHPAKSFFSSRISLASSFKKDLSKIRIIN